MDFSEEKIIF